MVWTSLQRVDDFAGIMNLLGETSRLRIVLYLFDKEASVSEIITHLQMSQPLVSHHLKLLKEAHILKSKKQGKKMIYGIANSLVKDIVEVGLIGGQV
ncbi:MAG: metalloregulator ArsR/SmtB family transcription factor [Prevotella sp.]|nr:metalloregulator ArsR/SmtB family transcription factor [Staphylococcus sp.]MCM1350252.1 metalloregulator ArsR/SmtB family transcription factor [Prevotella sp.]